MEDEKTPVELIAADIGPELDKLINDFLARPVERRETALRSFMWDNKVGLLRVAQAYGPLIADLRETLRAVLHHFGPSGAHTVTSHVMAARKARESNKQIDKLEKIFGDTH